MEDRPALTLTSSVKKQQRTRLHTRLHCAPGAQANPAGGQKTATAPTTRSPRGVHHRPAQHLLSLLQLEPSSLRDVLPPDVGQPAQPQTSKFYGRFALRHHGCSDTVRAPEQ